MEHNIDNTGFQGLACTGVTTASRPFDFPLGRVLGLGAGLLFMFFGTGCYTQLYTADYVNRDADRISAYPASSRPGVNGYPMGDTLAPPRAGDTLVAETRPVTVIAANDQYAYYHGYSELEWDYPFLSFELYSHRYREYDHPYWWDSRARNPGVYVPGHNTGDDRSPRPIRYSQNPAYPSPQRGRRATYSDVGASSSSGESAYNHSASKSGSSSSGESSSSASSGSSEKASTSSGGGEKASTTSSSSSSSSSSTSSSGNASSGRSESAAPEVHKGRRE